MNSYLHNLGAIVAMLTLGACAATNDHSRRASALIPQNPACLTETGSRIARDGNQCTAFGRSYSSTDLQRTGATTADDALRLLDPAISTHR